MKLIKLKLASFRNLQNIELAPGKKFNVFYGNNGQGKTNLLESIYLLATMKSFKQARNAELIAFAGEFALVKGTVERDQVRREIAVLIEKQGKKAKVDAKLMTRLDDFFGNLNVVLFTPEEISMVRGGPDLRRRYLDRAVFTCDLGYLTAYHDYAKILKNRNALLKVNETTGIEVWTEQLVQAALLVIERRKAYLDRIGKLLQGFYSEISGNDETVQIEYRLHGVDERLLAEDPAGALNQALRAHAAEERRRGTTAIGPHRDDLYFGLNGRSARQFASQGQQRSFVLALKMAEIEHITRCFEAPPVLLLDDMTSELDRERNRNLMEFLKKREMQVFITTTSLHNVDIDELQDNRTFRIKEGKILD
ncbi:DNA replication and repair protein RecF [Citrifermentans bemidjiense Bem]|uniref:DNA replication and repair protein RecF n=1 Tax=Citrifermentans bemidjiense (strain ATCC BAA-1014 / DSM 16622 / JCM 12645 / Bem) TaxID=404380 RepID=RECF_CITBB|nr:DNA replication/repair protein RecF [Citrifermentans bemidjiense]B5E7P8.1 RecName: Full=DNA replication and repair protein RecF [Citrifermentans bemidjiense Bem]ACH37036.1 DNA replication and repair protein RecF [Citrifermentans bemidjiense Bem]